MTKTVSFFVLITSIYTSFAMSFTNSVSVDSFVRAAAPTLNYGGAGALSVAGSNAVNAVGTTNGAFDSFIRFNTAAMVASFDSALGTNNWIINGARLRVTELGAPAQALFNRGVGGFEIRWITNDNWIEGTGNPGAPTTTGITFNDEATLLNPGTDVSLGTFTNAGADGVLSFPLALPSAFLSDLRAGGEVGLFLKPLDSTVGFTFDSRSFGTVAARPFLEISAVRQPGIETISVSGSDVLLGVTNASTGGIYSVLTSTNVTLPLNQWTSCATNAPAPGANFALTITNGFSTGFPKSFFVLQTQ